MLSARLNCGEKVLDSIRLLLDTYRVDRHPDVRIRPIVDERTVRPGAGGLALIKELVGQECYRLSGKVYDLLSEGYFDLEDLENSILCGSVFKVERDERADCLGNKKYVILGPDKQGYEFYSVGKIKKETGGYVYFVITARYAEVNYA